MKKGKLAFAIAALGLGLFMTMLDSTIVNISIPAMMDDFQVGVSTISWVLDAYLMTLAVLALTMGRLADQFGRRRMYIIGLTVFTVGSLLCALSWNVGWLVGFRVLQGIGGAVMIPVTMAIMTASFPAERRGAAMGIWAAIGITAAAVGPSLGGVIVEHLSWDWVFYINIPIGMIAIALSMFSVAESKDPSSPKELDLVGMGVLCVSVLSLVLAVIQGEEWGWGSGRIVGLFAAAGVAFVLFVLWERRQDQPMLDLTLFRNTTFSSAVVCQALVAFGMLGAIFLLTLFLQRVLGYSALKAAVAVTPIPGTALVLAPIAGRVCDKIEPRIPAIVGVIASGLRRLSLLAVGCRLHLGRCGLEVGDRRGGNGSFERAIGGRRHGKHDGRERGRRLGGAQHQPNGGDDAGSRHLYRASDRGGLHGTRRRESGDTVYRT